MKTHQTRFLPDQNMKNGTIVKKTNLYWTKKLTDDWLKINKSEFVNKRPSVLNEHYFQSADDVHCYRPALQWPLSTWLRKYSYFRWAYWMSSSLKTKKCLFNLKFAYVFLRNCHENLSQAEENCWIYIFTKFLPKLKVIQMCEFVSF